MKTHNHIKLYKITKSQYYINNHLNKPEYIFPYTYITIYK